MGDGGAEAVCLPIIKSQLGGSIKEQTEAWAQKPPISQRDGITPQTPSPNPPQTPTRPVPAHSRCWAEWREGGRGEGGGFWLRGPSGATSSCLRGPPPSKTRGANRANECGAYPAKLLLDGAESAHIFHDTPVMSFYTGLTAPAAIGQPPIFHSAPPPTPPRALCPNLGGEGGRGGSSNQMIGYS